MWETVLGCIVGSVLAVLITGLLEKRRKPKPYLRMFGSEQGIEEAPLTVPTAWLLNTELERYTTFEIDHTFKSGGIKPEKPADYSDPAPSTPSIAQKTVHFSH